MSVNQTEQKMKAAIDHLKEELMHIRTGRADPAILYSVQVEVYGSAMRLQDLASISVPEPRQLLVTAYDMNNLGAIRKGIEKANLNLQPHIDGNMIRINIPAMDEIARKNMVKLVRKKGEEAKVSIRTARRDGNDALKKQKLANEIAEDIQKKGENKIQQLTDSYCKEADSCISTKEKSLLEI